MPAVFHAMTFPHIPQPPHWKLDWPSLNDDFDFIRDMKGCLQEPAFHAEGDVWTHTQMVCEALIANDRWRALPEDDREVVFIAALMHDIGKPACTRKEQGRITSRGHSGHGEVMVRELLWEAGVPLPRREQIANMVRWHQIPFFIMDRDNARRLLYEVSQTVRCGLLALVTEADGRGRVCEGQQLLLDNIALFEQFAAEEQCLMQPRQFANDHSRFLYFRKEDRDAEYEAFDDTTCEVILMSGLPGAGKDYWIAANAADWPIISLDAIRREMGIKPSEGQGAVVARAREMAREHLRHRQSFVWNATNISREMRERSVSLCAAYNARVRIVYVEAPADRLFKQNEAREHRVPASVLKAMLSHWQPPDLTEAHRVDVITGLWV
jgi:putative nucleotidyltransferase with HDIG domain